MQQVLWRAIGLLRRPWVLLYVLGVGGGGCAFALLPLLSVPGFELALALTLLVGVLGFIPGIAAARQERRLIQGKDPRPRHAVRFDGALTSAVLSFGAATVWNLAVLVPPFIAAALVSLLRTQCDPWAQSGFYPLLTLPTALFASAASVAIGLWARSVKAAVGLYVLVLLGSLAVTFWPLYAGPQVFAFNHFLGYFPGPLYDETLVLRPALYWFRIQTLLWACAVFLWVAFTLDMREGRLGWPRLRPGSLALLSMVVLCAGWIEANAPELGLRMSEPYLRRALGGLRETAHFELVYPRGKPKEELDRLERDLEFRHHQLQAFLGGAPTGKIRVYLYRSPEEKAAWVGAGQTQFSKPWQLSLHINDGPFPHPVVKHELLHVMASEWGTGPFKITSRFGVWPQMAIVEGLAVAGDNHPDELTLHQWAAAMRKDKLAPELSELFSPQGFYKTQPQRAYTVAGSFLRYLADTYGSQKLRALYAHGDFAGAYGKALPDLSAEWARFVDAIPLDAAAERAAYLKFHRPSLFARACAREVASLEDVAAEELQSDPSAAQKRYEHLVELDPHEVGFKVGLAKALAALDRREEAQSTLALAADQTREAPALLAEVEMARADLAWRTDALDRATAHLQKVVALDPGPTLERTARVKLLGLASPRSQGAVRAYFDEGHEDVKLLVLREASTQDPENAALSYLLGRKLTQSSAPTLALPYLETTLSRQVPESVRKETLKLRLLAQYLSGGCGEVTHQVGSLPDYGPAFALFAKEWVERCAFETDQFHGALVPQGPFK